MITSERQYRITRNKLARFVDALGRFEANARERTDVHPQLLLAEREAMESQLAALCEEVEEYQRVKVAGVSGQVVESRL